MSELANIEIVVGLLIRTVERSGPLDQHELVVALGIDEPRSGHTPSSALAQDTEDVAAPFIVGIGEATMLPVCWSHGGTSLVRSRMRTTFECKSLSFLYSPTLGCVCLPSKVALEQWLT